MATRLVTGQDLVDTARAAGQDHLDALTRATRDAHDDYLLDQGRAPNPLPPPPPEGTPPAPPRRGQHQPTKAQHRLDRLTGHRPEVLAFLDDFRVPFDHHQAERDLRLMNVPQKSSGGFRSVAGAAACARLRGSRSTLRKQGLPLLRALEGVFAGSPLVPNLAAE